MEERARPANIKKTTPPRVFLPAFLNKQRQHFAEAIGDSASGCSSLGVKSFVFRLVEPVSSTS